MLTVNSIVVAKKQTLFELNIKVLINSYNTYDLLRNK